MTQFAICVTAVFLLTTSAFAAPPSTEEEQVWGLEQAYWHYVQTNDLEHYRALWHAEFLGWPSFSPNPMRKDHIADWMTVQSQNSESLKSYHLEKLAVQAVRNVATTTYRVRLVWVDKSGNQEVETSRILHTWLRDSGGNWHIISGMSAPTNPEGR